MAEEELRGLDWDEEIDDGAEFENIVFPEGDYDFTVKSFKRDKARESGNNMAVLELEVTDGKKKALIKDWIVLTTKTKWKIASFFRSVGLKKHGENIKMKWQESVGTTGRCTLSVEERTSNKGNTYKVNQIESYLDPIDDNIEDVEW